MDKINLNKIIKTQLFNKCINIEGYIDTKSKIGNIVINDSELHSKIKSKLEGSSSYWFVEDEYKRKITMMEVSCNDYFPSNEFYTLHKKIILGAHLEEHEKIKSIEFKIQKSTSDEDSKILSYIKNIEFNYKNLIIKLKKDEMILISISGESTLNEVVKIFKYFCEFIFLFYGIYLEYYTAEIKLCDGETCEFITYGHKFKYEKRKRCLTDSIQYGTINYDNFENFIKFRKDSGIIFDIILNTVYSQSFEEDYPLRLSQCIDGMIGEKSFINRKSKEHFKDTIIKAINYDDSLKNLFDYDNFKISEFADKTKNHRHLFSHAKYKSDMFKGKENKDAAIKLYSILRFIIIKECVEKKYFDV